MKLTLNTFKAPLLAVGMSLATVCAAQTKLPEIPQDTFEYEQPVTPKGVNSVSVLLNAPSPKVDIAGNKMLATIVVDLKKNILYKYDSLGNVENAYLIASGKKSTPTDTGIRVVKNIEKYPYKSAPKATKRYKNPNDYGPRILILEKVNPLTGEKSPTGEFIHGNRNQRTLGQYVSKGCMRMDNDVIKQLALSVKKGDIVVITSGEEVVNDSTFDNQWFK